jgi:hypothetical protein
VNAVRGFVSHAFDDAVYEGGRDAFRECIDQLVGSACADFRADSIEVEHKLFFEATTYGEPLMPAVRGQIRSSDFLIADITQLDPTIPVNPNVMYEVGYAMALGKPVMVIRRNSEPPPPTDIGDLLAGAYADLPDLKQKFLPRTIGMIGETLAKADRDANRVEPHIWNVWFPADTRSINIVCAREAEPTKFSDGRQPNYVHIDNFEDRDALLELSGFFARRYPQATVVHHISDEMPHGTRSCDLVVLGGPGCAPGEGNCVAQDLMEMLDSQVSYPKAGDGMVWRGEALRPTSYEDDDDTRGVVADWGSILAAPNPYNPAARVILLHGTTTYGTLGAALALTDSTPAMRNHLRLASAKIANRLTGAINFEAIVRAEVDSGRRVKPPKLDPSNVRRIDG